MSIGEEEKGETTIYVLASGCIFIWMEAGGIWSIAV
jgi:hypothetical protein